MPDVANGENPRNTGFQVERIAPCSPSCWTLAFEHQVLTGDDVALRVAFDNTGKRYEVANIVNDKTLFDEAAYKAYSPI